MKTSIKVIMFLGLLLAAPFALTKTIIISDIDDTLKMTHVNSSVDRIDEALKIDNVFYLMPDLLRQAKADKVFYVSNAPQSVMGNAHRRFLAHNQFPEGEVHLRPGIWSPKDKKPVLREIINRELPSIVILLGDNAEQDPEFYAQIQTEYPGIRFITFIRWAYAPSTASSIKSGQIPFVSAGEIALHLDQRKLFNSDQVLGLVILSATNLSLPAWLNCIGHVPILPVREGMQEWTNKLRTAVNDRCNRPLN